MTTEREPERTDKMCTLCLETKPINEFYKKNYGKYGVTGRCKVCYPRSAPQPYSLPRPLPKAKSYKDYLKEAGLTDYNKRCSKYFI